jgi:anti-sigma B factor antagonist
MKSIIEKLERYTIVTIKEKNLTISNSSDLKSEIAIMCAEGNSSILLNLEDVEFIDSSGLGAILNADRTTEDNKGFLVLYGLNSQVYNLIKIAKLDKVFSIAGSEKEARDLLVMEELDRDLAGNEEEA